MLPIWRRDGSCQLLRWGKVKLLIVDDHAGMRELIRHVAQGVATEVHECASGEAAVELCRSYAPDCVTMDLRMGQMHGLTAVRLIRETHPQANIAVVTQYDHAPLRTRAQQAGADAYICKDDLNALRTHLETLAATRALTQS
jgi:two-component system, chemotaxis family, chemotaxis protein CheY